LVEEYERDRDYRGEEFMARASASDVNAVFNAAA
jgi:hypothetical protein